MKTRSISSGTFLTIYYKLSLMNVFGELSLYKAGCLTGVKTVFRRLFSSNRSS
jgi:hypothetical protein